MEFYRYVMEMNGSSKGENFPMPKVTLLTFPLLKETKCGYWIDVPYSQKNLGRKWILKVSRKRWAYPTKERAMVNFIKRTQKRRGYASWETRSCEIALNMVRDNSKYPNV